MKLDVRKFFPSIDHEILKGLLRKKIKDVELLMLLDEIIESVDKGVPIGNYLSQYFGNFYLTYFDHWMKEVRKAKCYFRYMDDIVILHNSKKYLHRLLKLIKLYFKVKLKLVVKNNYQVFPTYIRGVDFLGYRSFGSYTLLRKSTCKRFKKEMKKLRNSRVLTQRGFNSLNSYKGRLS